MAKWAILNGAFVADPEARIHYSDLSFQRGYGVFDFFRLVGDHPLFLNDHLSRFYRSAEALHLQPQVQPEELRSQIFALIAKNNLTDTGIRLSLTGGYSADSFTPSQPNLLVSQQSFSPPTAEQRQADIRLLSYPYQRQLAFVKSIDYLMAIWLQPLKQQKGVDDFLYHNGDEITECPRSNFFLVTKNDCIVTPSNNILYGITRQKLIDVAKKHYQVEERPIHPHEITTAKEAFITSTTKQVLGVAQIDETVFPSTEITRNLQALFQSVYLT